MRIYITFCSAKKNDSLKNTGIEVPLDVLYISKNRIRPFMETCKQKNVKWAIFSDLYGIWFPEDKHTWYEKSPNDVIEPEFKALLTDFDDKVQEFDEIYFYRPSPVYFHSLYRRLLKETRLRDRIRIISSIIEIE